MSILDQRPVVETAVSRAAGKRHGTKMIRRSDLAFGACEGDHAKDARACTWPCAITQMDPNDELDRACS